jgi:hypothetical protein
MIENDVTLGKPHKVYTASYATITGTSAVEGMIACDSTNHKLGLRTNTNWDWMAMLATANVFTGTQYFTGIAPLIFLRDTEVGHKDFYIQIDASVATFYRSDMADVSMATFDLSTGAFAIGGHTVGGTDGGKTTLAVTSGKTLTLTSTDSYNLTIPASGTPALLATANVFTTNQFIISGDNKDTGPILNLAGSAANQVESGRIRFTEVTTATSYQGGFVHYNGSTNSFHLGVHPTNDVLTASDINSISIARANGFVGIGTVSPLNNLHLSASNPVFIIGATAGDANNRLWDFSTNAGAGWSYLYGGVLNDAVSSRTIWLDVRRTDQTINYVGFPGGTIVINEDGVATNDFRVESDTEAYMIYLDANGDTDGAWYMGGTTNGIKVIKGGNMSFLGTAGFYPRRIRQDDIPASGTSSSQIDVGEMLFWCDSNDSDHTYLVFYDPTHGILKINMEA